MTGSWDGDGTAFIVCLSRTPLGATFARFMRTNYGIEVVGVAELVDAIEAAEHYSAAIVVDLPERDRPDAIAVLNSDLLTWQIPVFVLSDHVMADKEREAVYFAGAIGPVSMVDPESLDTLLAACGRER